MYIGKKYHTDHEDQTRTECYFFFGLNIIFFCSRHGRLTPHENVIHYPQQQRVTLSTVFSSVSLQTLIIYSHLPWNHYSSEPLWPGVMELPSFARLLLEHMSPGQRTWLFILQRASYLNLIETFFPNGCGGSETFPWRSYTYSRHCFLSIFLQEAKRKIKQQSSGVKWIPWI